MCIICSRWELGKLTNKEALLNIGEMIVAEKDNEHYYAVVDKIMIKELGSLEEDIELNAAWHKETHGD